MQSQMTSDPVRFNINMLYSPPLTWKVVIEYSCPVLDRFYQSFDVIPYSTRYNLMLYVIPSQHKVPRTTICYGNMVDICTSSASLLRVSYKLDLLLLVIMKNTSFLLFGSMANQNHRCISPTLRGFFTYHNNLW